MHFAVRRVRLSEPQQRIAVNLQDRICVMRRAYNITREKKHENQNKIH